MPVFQFAQRVLSHKAAFVNISVDAMYVTFAGVLPECVVAVVLENRFLTIILRYHKLIVIKLVLEVLVVEVRAGVYQRLLVEVALYQIKELEKRIAEFLSAQTGICLHVNHRDEVLFTATALGDEVLKLSLLLCLWTIEMI